MTNQYFSETALCTSADVLSIAYGKSDTSSLDYTASDILQAISDAEEEVLLRYGTAMRSQFFIESDQTEYEFRPDNGRTYIIKQLAIDDINNQDTGISYQNSGSYTVDLRVNKITFSSAQVSGWANRFCYVDYIPYSWHLLIKNKAALNLLDGDAALMSPGDGTVDNPRVSRIAKRISRIESDLMPDLCEGSEENRNYDPRTIDRPYIKQVRFR